MRFSALAPVLLTLLVVVPAPSDAGSSSDDPVCLVIQHQERVDLEEMELEVQLARTRHRAAAQIFDLVDPLWKDEIIEEIIHLTAKRDNDVAELQIERQALLLRRQEALVDQLRILCSSSGSKQELQEAQRRYFKADCDRIGKDLAIARVDLAYLEAWLASMVDLRANVATKQDVIWAEHDVERARDEIAHRSRRFKACADSP